MIPLIMFYSLPITICLNLNKGSSLSTGGTYGTIAKFAAVVPLGPASSPGCSTPSLIVPLVVADLLLPLQLCRSNIRHSPSSDQSSTMLQ